MGFLLPIRFTSRIYLAKQLRKQGIDTAKIPDACMQEMADIAVSLNKFEAGMTNAASRTLVPKSLESQAAVIADILDNTPMDGVWSEYATPFRDILNRHGVKVRPSAARSD
jgi:hypothetical protein